MVSFDSVDIFHQTPPTANAVVYKADDKVIAKVYRPEFDRWDIIAEGTAGVDDADVIQSVDGCQDIMKIIVITDIITNKPLYFEKTKYLKIDFIGHSVICNAGCDYSPFINYKVDNGEFILKNLTLDNQNTVGDGITAGGEGIYPKKVIVENVEIKNFTNHGFYFRVADPSQPSDEKTEHDIILKNIKVYTSNSLNECLTVDNARKVIINNAEFIGNKIAYIVSSETVVKNIYYNTSNWGFTSRSRKIIYENITADGIGLNAHIVVEPYVSMELKNQFDNNYLTIINGFRGIGNHCRIKLRPYDDNYVLKNVVIDGVTQQQTPIEIETPTNYATIETLEVKNVKFLSYSFAYQIIHDTNVSIKNLVIDSVELPGINSTYTRAIYVKNDKANREINAVIKSITRGLPYVGQSDDGGNGYGITGEIDIDKLLYTNFWQLTSGTSTPKLRRNSGIYTLNANGTTTTYTIPHGLVSTPNYVNVLPKGNAPKPDSIDWDATNITLTFNKAPAAGTYYYAWEARI